MLTSLIAIVAAQIAVQPPMVSAPPPPAPPPSSTPPRLRGGSISDDDYPAAAIRARHEGSTRLQLAVGLNGRVTNCTVARSSGSAVLDSTSCALAQRRFRFDPASRSGTLVASEYLLNISWRLPDDLPMIVLASGRMTWSAVASPPGGTGCNIATEGPAFAGYTTGKCAGAVPLGLVVPEAIGAAGENVEVVQILDVVTQDERASAASPPNPIWEVAARLDVNEQGKVVRCTPGPTRGMLPAFVRPDLGSLCDALPGGRWFANSLAAPQTVSLRSRIYVRPAASPRPDAR